MHVFREIGVLEMESPHAQGALQCFSRFFPEISGFFGGDRKFPGFFKVIRIDKFAQERFKNVQNLHLGPKK